MNDNAKKWVEALRSGEYKQIRGQLRGIIDGEPHHCCLGVACDLYAKATGLGRWNDDLETFAYQGPHGPTYEGAVLPLPVRDWLGLADSAGEYLDYDLDYDHYGLAEANDAGQSFDEIADVIEGQPEGLFVGSE